MLKNSFNSALPFAEELAEKHLTIAPIPGSALGELCTLSSPISNELDGGMAEPNLETSNAETRMAIFSSNLDFHTSDQGGGHWGASFDTTVDELTRIVARDIAYIRNTVVPRTIEYANKVTASLEEFNSMDPTRELEIDRRVLPELVTDPSFLGLLDPFRGKSAPTPGTQRLSFPFKEVPAFLEVASLSNARLDNLVLRWNNQDPLDTLRRVWFSYFAAYDLSKGEENAGISEDEFNSPDPYLSLNASLAYFLIATHYSNHLPDVVVSESKQGLERRLYEHQLYAAGRVISALARIQDNIKNGILVAAMDPFHKKITVTGEIYDRWLSTGGKPEAILGLLVSGRRLYQIDQIIEASKDLESEWNRYSRVHTETLDRRRSESLARYYLDAFEVFMTGPYIDQVEDLYLRTSPQHLTSSVTKAKVYLNGLRKEELFNIQKVAKDLIAGVKYGFTYALPFISDMEDVGVNADNVIPEEAAFVATINYITDYLRGQLIVIRN